MSRRPVHSPKGYFSFYHGSFHVTPISLNSLSSLISSHISFTFSIIKTHSKSAETNPVWARQSRSHILWSTHPFKWKKKHEWSRDSTATGTLACGNGNHLLESPRSGITLFPEGPRTIPVKFGTRDIIWDVKAPGVISTTPLMQSRLVHMLLISLN